MSAPRETQPSVVPATATQGGAGSGLPLAKGVIEVGSLRSRVFLQRAPLACGLKDDKTHIGKLIDLLDDPETSVQRAAYVVLKRLTSQDFGPPPDAAPPDKAKAVVQWKAWWKKQTGL